MEKITKKEFIELLTSNKSEFLQGGYSELSITEAIEYLKNYDFSTFEGEGIKRQASKHSQGLKFLMDDNTYSYLDNLTNHVYFKKDNILIVIEKREPSRFIGIYRIVE